MMANIKLVVVVVTMAFVDMVDCSPGYDPDVHDVEVMKIPTEIWNIKTKLGELIGLVAKLNDSISAHPKHHHSRGKGKKTKEAGKNLTALLGKNSAYLAKAVLGISNMISKYTKGKGGTGGNGGSQPSWQQYLKKGGDKKGSEHGKDENGNKQNGGKSIPDWTQYLQKSDAEESPQNFLKDYFTEKYDKGKGGNGGNGGFQPSWHQYLKKGEHSKGERGNKLSGGESKPDWTMFHKKIDAKESPHNFMKEYLTEKHSKGERDNKLSGGESKPDWTMYNRKSGANVSPRNFMKVYFKEHSKHKGGNKFHNGASKQDWNKYMEKSDEEEFLNEYYPERRFY